MNLYNKIYKAINEGVSKSLRSFNIDIDDETPVTYQRTDIVKHQQHEADKLEALSKWTNINIEHALALELHTSNLNIFFKKDSYEIRQINQDHHAMEYNMYDEANYIYMEAANSTYINELLTFNGWSNIDVNINDYEQNTLHNDNIEMIKNIYDPEFIKNNVKGIYFSPTHCVICLMYTNGRQMDVSFLMGAVITDEFYNKCMFHYNIINNKSSIMQILKTLKLANIINKYGFMPAYDENHNYYFETYFICSVAEYKSLFDQYNPSSIIQHYKKLYTQLINCKSELLKVKQNNDRDDDTGTVFYVEVAPNSIFKIHQFVQQVPEMRCGWRIEYGTAINF